MIKKVEDIGYRNRGYGVPAKLGVSSKASKSPSFTGKVPQMPTSSLKDAIEYLLPKSARIFKKLGSSGGEIQNIIINAVGTGLVAPIFIKYNFLSEADEDTRTYSAWRQPMSAVLAIATQAGLTAPFYRIFDNWSNNGTFGEELNKTPFQDDYYLKKLIKKRNPNATKSQIKDMLASAKNTQRTRLIQTLEDESTVFYTSKDGSKFKISDSAYKNLLNETINKLEKSDIAALNNIEKTIEKRTERSKFYRAHNQEVAELLEEFHTKIAGAANLKQIDNYLAGKISEFRGNKNRAGMTSIVEEISRRAKVVSGGNNGVMFNNIQQGLLEKVEKMQEHVKKYKNIATEQEVENVVKGIVEEEKLRLQSALDFYKSIKTTISEKTNIAELKKLIEAKAKELKIKDSGLNKNFVEEVANQLIARSKTNMKWYKQFVGVFVSLSILPVTCTLLNWIYPRFMDVFFPNLSAKKHNNESAKLVSIAPKMEDLTNKTVSQPARSTLGQEVSLDSFKKKVEVA